MTTMLGCGFLEEAEFEAWFDGRLDAGRAADFERHLAAGCGSCALLAEDRRVFQESVPSTASRPLEEVFEARRPMLERRLAAEAAKAVAVPTSPWRRLAPWAGLAAAAALAVAIVVPLRRSAVEPLTIAFPAGVSVALEPLPFDAPPSVRAGSGDRAAWDAAGVAYSGRRWDEAARLFGALAAREDAVPDAALYQGIALLSGGHAGEARAALDRARERAAADALPTGAIDWFRALAALAEKDAAGAKAALDQAIEAGGPYAGRARALRARIPF
jgi:hypothetical protein